MKKLSQLAFTLLMIISLSLITGANTASAQSGDTDTSGSNGNSCVTLDNNLRYRMRDISVNNEVSDLQDYLIAEGYLSGNTTGYFGVATLKAVKSFQAANGLLSSGYVGPVTRAKIKSLSCEVVSSPANPPMPTKPVACTMEARMCPDGSTMYRDGNCVWHAEMCKAVSANYGLKITSLTASIIPNQTASDAQLFKIEVYGFGLNSIDLLEAETLNGTVTINRNNFVEATDNKIVFNYKVPNGDKYTMNIVAKSKGGFVSLVSNVMSIVVDNSKAVNTNGDAKITSLAASVIPDPSTRDTPLFKIEVYGQNLNTIDYLQTEMLVNGTQNIYRSSFVEASDNKIVFNHRVCAGCKYMLSISTRGKAQNPSNVMPILIDNSTPSKKISISSATLKEFDANQVNLMIYGTGFKNGASININGCSAGSAASLSGNSDTETSVGFDKTYLLGCVTPGTYANVYIAGNGTDNSNTYSVYVPMMSVKPTITSSFSSNQLPGYTVASTYTYQIQNYRDGLVLDVELRTADCLETGGYRKDCSKYLFNLSGKAAESYSGVGADPYVKGGSGYRFTGSNGQINITSFQDLGYVPVYPYTNPIPLNIYYKFILRDTKNGGAEVWSETKSFGFPG